MNRYSIERKIIAACLLVAVCSGCSILPKPPAEGYKYFVLETKTCETPVSPSSAIAVEAVAALPGTDSKKILFATDRNRRGFYQYASWLNIPSAMFRQMLASKLDCEAETAGGQGGLLETEIISFQHNIAEKPGTVEIVIKNSLVTKNSNEVLKTKVFSYSEPVDSYDSEGAVTAFQRASDKYLEAVAHWAKN